MPRACRGVCAGRSVDGLARSLLLVLLSSVTLLAGPVQFSGSASVTVEQNSLGGTQQTSDPDITFSLCPTLDVYGMPISLSVLFASRGPAGSTAWDWARLYMQPEGLARQLPHVPGIITAVKSIEVGACGPSYSPLTLSGVTVSGVAVELNPWQVYLAGAVGRTQSAVEGSDTATAQYYRRLYATRFGFGKLEKTHFHFTFLHAADDSTSIQRNFGVWQPDTCSPPDTYELVRPQENFVLGSEFRLSLFNSAFVVDAELAGAEFTRDSRSPVLSVDWLPDWVERNFRPRFTSQYDYAWRVKPTLKLLGARLHGELKMVGPGYRSLGLSYLRNDIYGFTAGVERRFLRDALTTSLTVTRERDNLIGLKRTTTTFTSLALASALNLPRLPYLSLSYCPYMQGDDGMHIASASTGHRFATGSITHSPGLSVSVQRCQTQDAERSYSGNDFGASYGLGFRFPLSLSASAGMSRSTYADGEQCLVYLNVTPGYTLFRRWSNRLTWRSSFESSGARHDIRLGSSLALWKLADANLDLGRSFRRAGDESGEDWRVCFVLSKRW